MEEGRVIRGKNGFGRWWGAVALAAIGVATFPSEGVAQVPEVDPGLPEEQAVAVEEWIGRWSGPFESDGPSGLLTIIIAMDGDEWRVEGEIVDAGAPPGGPVRGWGIRDNRFEYLQWFDDIELAVRGRMVEGALVGEMEASQEGVHIGLATFRLVREILPPVDPPAERNDP